MVIKDVAVIKKLYEIHDEADGNFYVAYTAPRIGGGVAEAVVPREQRSPKQIIAALRAKGAELLDDDTALEAAQAAIASAAPLKRRAAKMGFSDDGSVYVTFAQVHGGGASEVELLPPKGAASRYGGQLALHGTLEQWQIMARIARYSTAMCVCLAAVFATVLLRLLERPAFAIMLVAKSRSGKSTSQSLAASAQGFSRENDMVNLTATLNALMEAAAVSNDHALFINEAATAAGKKDSVYIKLVEHAYNITGGRDKLRHSSYDGEKHKPFQTIAVLSSEKMPQEWSQLGGNASHDGELVRLIGVPVAYDERFGVYDRVSEAFLTRHPDCVYQWNAYIRKNTPLQCGVANETFIQRMFEKRNFHEVAAKLMGQCEQRFGRGETDIIKLDIANKFATLCTGGVLAIRAEVLPLDEATFVNAMHRACRWALAALPDPRLDLTDDLQRLASLLASGSILDIEKLSNPKPYVLEQADGIKRHNNGATTYIVRLKTVRICFPNLARLQALLGWLDAEGYLRASGKARSDGSLDWVSSQPRWYGEFRPRSIELVLPADLDSLQVR